MHACILCRYSKGILMTYTPTVVQYRNRHISGISRCLPEVCLSPEWQIATLEGRKATGNQDTTLDLS